MAKIDVSGVYVTVVKLGSEDYISLTDMMRSKDGEFFFHNWLRNRNTVEFLGTWEKVFNPEFNSAEFDIIKARRGSTISASALKNGWRRPAPLALFQKLIGSSLGFIRLNPFIHLGFIKIAEFFPLGFVKKHYICHRNCKPERICI